MDRSRPHRRTSARRHGNLGIAHGIAGPLALPALAHRRGVIVDGHIQAIARICVWFDAWVQHHPAGRWWPRTVTRAEHDTGRNHQTDPGRPSWCYGTPGIARAQQLAAIATGDTTRQHTAETALLGCLTDASQLDQITDLGLCHGQAGFLHTTHRAAADARTPHLRAHLDSLTTDLITRLHAVPLGAELLDGTTGAALALHTLATPASDWDACLLTN